MLIALIVIAVVVVLVVGFLWSVYNGLVKSRLNVKEAWAGIDVQLKRRSSLIPNLVETVKGYAAHERETLDSVTRARARLDSASGPADAALADNMLAAGIELTVSGVLLMASETMILDGSLETNGRFRLFAGAANDTLKGGAGKDSLLGQRGKDTLKGGAGKDFCKGGKGKDTASKCEVKSQ